MLRLDNLSVAYGSKKIIDGLSYHFTEEAVYAIVGKSGSGKSTLLKAVASILPYEGQVLWNGEPLTPKTHRIALAPQTNGLIPWKTVAENISLPSMLRGVWEEKTMAELCGELGISHLLGDYPRHISGGECQRAAMARAFLIKPHVLLLDEAFGALDAITREEVHRVFLDAFRRHSVTTLMVTHDIAEALVLAHYLLIFRQGRIVETLELPSLSAADRSTLIKEIKEKL